MSIYNSQIKTILVTVLFVVVIFLCLPIVCGHGHSHGQGNGHGHSHGHSHEEGNSHGHSHEHEEPPSFKWSKEANIAYETQNNEHVHNANFAHEELKKSTSKSSTYPANPNLWFEAMGATILISIAPYLILFIIPVTNSKEHEPYLKILLAFTSGGLLGDAFLHLIPHALMAKGNINYENSHSHSHGHSHSHLNNYESDDEHSHSHDITIGTSVLGGIIVFLIVEKFVRIFKGGHSHSHGLSHDKVSDDKSKKDKKLKNEKENGPNISEGGNMKIAGYLNLAADFTHNFTDGLAIGASFLAGKSVGIVTTFTIFLHEIPHEIGDFAILLKSGCSKRKAMLLQLVTAVGALAGTWVSLMAEGAGDAAIAWILPFTAGGFIYIATVSVIPELLESSHFWQSVVEVTALLLGVALMMVITWVEEMGHA